MLETTMVTKTPGSLKYLPIKDRCTRCRAVGDGAISLLTGGGIAGIINDSELILGLPVAVEAIALSPGLAAASAAACVVAEPRAGCREYYTVNDAKKLVNRRRPAAGRGASECALPKRRGRVLDHADQYGRRHRVNCRNRFVCPPPGALGFQNTTGGRF